MKNKLIRILIIIFSILLLANVSLASQLPQATPPDQKISDTISNTTNAILSTVQLVGTAVAVIMIMVIAIKYFSAAPGEKAELKKKLVVYIVGAVILFAATGIIQIVKVFGTGLDSQSQPTEVNKLDKNHNRYIET